MGITKLADLIRSDAPGSISYKDITDYTGRVIALDTSIILNQFRAATPSLSPLTGLFFRTLTFLEHGIKPVFVFDGKPPGEKMPVLEKRAETAGWNYSNRTGTASLQTKECLQLLKCLGVPAVQAPGDAEALCAQLVREGTVYAVASEDMDTLPFGASVLIRQLNAKKDRDGLAHFSKSAPNSAQRVFHQNGSGASLSAFQAGFEVIEYSLPRLLEKLQITHKELVDLCILLGCDYCDKIPGLGPKRALTLIQKHRTIENVVLHINRQTHPVPHLWKYKEARKIFLEPPQSPAPELIWKEPDEEALVEFLCHTKRVKEERIRKRMVRFRDMLENKREKEEKAEGNGRQTRMEDYFRVTRKRAQPAEAASSSTSNGKRPKSK